MSIRTSPRRPVAPIVSVAGVCLVLLFSFPGPTAVGAQFTLDQLVTSYAAGDHQIVARTITRSIDFHHLKVLERQRLDAWLGAWQRPRAAVLLELTNISSSIAPAYTLTLLAAGRHYVQRRPRDSSTSADAEFERIWHRVAVGLLQRRYFVDAIDHYIDSLRAEHAALAAASRPPWDDRLDFARAVAQEQRCWTTRPSLRHPARPPGIDAGMAVPVKEVERATRCLQEALARFEVAAKGEDNRIEARIRAGWVQYQLGRYEDARRSLDADDEGEDPDLTYWMHLFRGRVNYALDRHADAERDYRAALALHSDAQSAGIGLALVLFRLHRDVEADEAAVTVRRQAMSGADPWWSYLIADDRFVDRWLVQLRKAAS